ncbi:MAG: transketolase [Thermoplasmata archaeon]|nr:transketolase [Thermoplasmata archaeon]
MVEAAKSGHPGLPLGAAPMAMVLWDRFLRHSPRNPLWPNRDRFVLSAGHGSALLYSLLHLTGYDLTLEDLQGFRRFGSRTPGHPEHGHTPGVEATTGPLGQGLANAVGMALAEHFLASRYNRPGFPVVDHWTYALVSDGDLMEGIASEAASFAGSMRVGKLLVLYDDNHISLEGPTSYSFTEDVRARMAAYGWGVQRVEDGNDLAAVDAAIREARSHPDRPQFISIRTHIGFGSPRQDTREAHGEPLGPEGTRATKTKLGWPLEPAFLVPDRVREHFLAAVGRGTSSEEEWNRLCVAYRSQFPDLAAEFDRSLRGDLPDGWRSAVPEFPTGVPMATRDAGAATLNALAQRIPNLLGGSADLSPSTKTTLVGMGDFSYGGESGRNLHFGVREHAMSAMLNGMALHGGVRPFGSTFLIFSDYARGAMRLAALQRIPSIFVFTHDSVAVGEDGPTHEPVEQLNGLRSVPGMTVIRPADANETAEAWRVALEQPGPTALALTRQKLPVMAFDRTRLREGVSRGGYVLGVESSTPAAVVLVGTGSEVSLCLAAQPLLEAAGISARVVSLPSVELFGAQSVEYRDSILPPEVPRVVVEAGATAAWHRLTGDRGAVVGLDRFGASGAGDVVMAQMGFTVDAVVAAARSVVVSR